MYLNQPFSIGSFEIILSLLSATRLFPLLYCPQSIVLFFNVVTWLYQFRQTLNHFSNSSSLGKYELRSPPRMIKWSGWLFVKLFGSSKFKTSLMIIQVYFKSFFNTIGVQQSFVFNIIIFSMNKTNKDLIKSLVMEGVIKNMQVAKAMEAVDRKYFAPHLPYVDSPQSIGFGATISAPHMHAYALEYLYQKLKTSKYVLDVGSGTGYLTAAMAFLVPPESKVFGVQHVPELTKKSIQNIQKSNPELLQKIKIKTGDGRLGWISDKNIKFDAIHVGAAAQSLPQALCQQLAQGGTMLIPLGGQYQFQKFLQVTKKEGKLRQKTLLSVRYVPLTDLKKQTQ